MISAADFDEVFGWNREQAHATLSGTRLVNPAVVADLDSSQAFRDDRAASEDAILTEVRHTSQISPAAVEPRPRELAAVAD